jgi:hypothetical protein
MSVDCVLVGSDGEGQKCYWGGKGKIVYKLSEAKVYSDYQAAERACKRIKKAKFFYNDVEAEQMTENITDFDELLEVTLEDIVNQATEEPVQAVCFSAQPVANGAEVPELAGDDHDELVYVGIDNPTVAQVQYAIDQLPHAWQLSPEEVGKIEARRARKAQLVGSPDD